MNHACRWHLLALVALVSATSVARAQSTGKSCNHGHTQLALNQCADDEFKAADHRLTGTYDRLLLAVSDSSRQALLRTAHEAWIVFREKQCRFEASVYEGGSMQPMQYFACMAVITREQNRHLRAL